MSPANSEDRPAKRMKMDTEKSHSISEVTEPRKTPKSRSQYRAQKAKASQGKSNSWQPATFSASGIHNDDVGIFVTSDKGQEKKCLQELSDLLEEFFDHDSDAHRSEAAGTSPSTVGEKEGDIEADISAELDSLRPQAATANGPAQKLSLVTLDIPCVSFVRFPIKTTVDPVKVVRQLCLTASNKDASGPRSRYIKRLTPVSLIRKTLNDGLETLCNEILPKDFLIDTDPANIKPDSQSGGQPTHQPCKFAIRPTIRNNNKMNRDEVIRIVADNITSLGQGKHSVNLKGYDRLVLVDVYRNVIGMSVVGSEYETLKKFNLAEIHASHFKGDDKERQNGGR